MSEIDEIRALAEAAPAAAAREHRVVVERLGRGLARKLGRRVDSEIEGAAGVLRIAVDRGEPLELRFSARAQLYTSHAPGAEARAVLERVRSLLAARQFRHVAGDVLAAADGELEALLFADH